MLATNNQFCILDEFMCNVCKGNLLLDTEKDEKICSSCGIVVREGNSLSSDGESTTEKAGMTNALESTSLMMYDIGLPTVIDNRNVDATGRHIHDREIDRLRRLNRFTISSNPKMKNLNKSVGEIRRITEIMGLNSLVAERASYIYRKILNKGAIRGRSISGIVSASICVACDDMSIPISIDKIAEIAQSATKKGINHYYKFILRELKMSSKVLNPTYCISQIAKRAALSAKAERKALRILDVVQGNPELSGKKPISLAAAALYLAVCELKENTTQLRIAIAAGITTITIRKRSVEISQILNNLKS